MKKLIMFTLILALFVIGCNINKNQNIVVNLDCKESSDCEWSIINCCPEREGAEWKCINKKDSILNCPNNPSCYTYISPKPTEDCACINNKCTKK